MHYRVYADGYYKMWDKDMTIGVYIVSEDTEEEWELSEYAGKGDSSEDAEYLAMYSGLSYLERQLSRNGGLCDIKSVVVFTDNQYILNHINNETKIENYRDYIQKEARSTMREKIIRLKRIFTKAGATVTFTLLKNKRAHELAAEAMRKAEAEKHYREQERNSLIEQIKNDQVVLPLSIFKKKEYEALTLAEILVVELIDNRMMRFSEVAEILGRSYNTVRNQYLRSKKKTAGMTPPRKLRNNRNS